MGRALGDPMHSSAAGTYLAECHAVKCAFETDFYPDCHRVRSSARDVTPITNLRHQCRLSANLCPECHPVDEPVPRMHGGLP